MFSQENLKILIEGSKLFHVEQSEKTIKNFFALSTNLLQWNKKINLTGISDEREIIIKHFLDSLSLCKYFHFTAGVKMLDMGTGAGFPGFPIYICSPEIDLFLNESTGKKVGFLKHINGLLFSKKPAIILHGRAEEFSNKPDLKESFDVVTARAVGKPSVVMKYVSNFLKSNGLFLAQLGPKEELAEFKRITKDNKMVVRDIFSISLPFSSYSRIVAEVTRM